MLYAKPKHIFSRRYRLCSDEQCTDMLGTMAMGGFKEAAKVQLGDEQYRFYREKSMSGDFLLEASDGTILARAEKPSMWKDQLRITFGELVFTLYRASKWKQDYTLTWQGEDAGMIATRRWFSNLINVELPDVLPLEVRAFILYLVVVMWNRAAAAAVS